MSKPTQAEVTAALDVIQRAAGRPTDLSVDQIAGMSERELDDAGITPAEMLEAVTKAGGLRSNGR